MFYFSPGRAEHSHPEPHRLPYLRHQPQCAKAPNLNYQKRYLLLSQLGSGVHTCSHWLWWAREGLWILVPMESAVIREEICKLLSHLTSGLDMIKITCFHINLAHLWTSFLDVTKRCFWELTDKRVRINRTQKILNFIEKTERVRTAKQTW
jgi:hypothetical protein